MKPQTLNTEAGQLDFFSMFDAVEDVIQMAEETSVLIRPHPPGWYLISSDAEQGFWSNDQGWVAHREFATPFSPEHACAAHVTQWRRDGKPIQSPRGHWHWVARGGLAGHRGADWDGPFESGAEALQAALDAIGPGKPLMTATDAEYVLADAAQPF